MEIHELLEQVKAGTLSIEEAKQYLRKEPFEELGYAKFDTHRKLRTGHAEVIYCEGKKGDVFVEVALQHNDSYNEGVYSFVNNITTPEGGTHLAGFRSALTKTFNDYARKNK